jgi:hypothetical protein
MAISPSARERWAIIALAGLVGFLAGLSHWVIARA